MVSSNRFSTARDLILGFCVGAIISVIIYIIICLPNQPNTTRGHFAQNGIAERLRKQTNSSEGKAVRYFV